MESQLHVSSTPTRDVTLDAARGVGIIFVLLWHTQPLAGFGIFASTALFGGSLYYWFNGLLSLVCVPLLYTVSLFLLFARCSKSPAYMTRRGLRLAMLLAFWIAIQFVAVTLATNTWPNVTWHVLRVGGPPLPLVGDSVFYFLVNLVPLSLLVALLAWVSTKLGDRGALWLSILLTACCVAMLDVLALRGVTVPYYALVGFLPYAPLAWLLVRSRGVLIRHPYRVAGVMLLAAAVNDRVIANVEGSAWSVYARGYLVFAVVFWLAMVCVLPQRVVRLLAVAGVWSLGLFALHKYVQYVLLKWELLIGLDVSHGLAGWLPLLNSLIVASGSAVLVWVVARSRLVWTVK